MHQNNLAKQHNKHANSFNLSPIVLKYSRNTKLNKILLGQLKESHTREQMLQISLAKMGRARRSKIASKNSKNSCLSYGVKIFWERE
jgi:hypothetical protein